MKPGNYYVRKQDAGVQLLAWLKVSLKLDGGSCNQLIAGGCIFIDKKQVRDPKLQLKGGARVFLKPSHKPLKTNQKKAEARVVIAMPEIIYFDDDIAIVEKPSGLTTVHHAQDKKEFSERDRKFMPSTLQDILPDILSVHTKKKVPYVRAVHRLDKETSGVLVFSLNKKAESSLGKQMREKKFTRRYIALVRGQIEDQEIRSILVRDRGDGRRGSSVKDPDGELAVTHVKKIESLGDISVVECELETGRTHQVRIHLGEANAPLCGEKIYDRPLNGRPKPDPSGIDRIALHACFLSFEHPTSGKILSWKSSIPPDMQGVIEKLREEKNKAPE